MVTTQQNIVPIVFRCVNVKRFQILLLTSLLSSPWGQSGAVTVNDLIQPSSLLSTLLLFPSSLLSSFTLIFPSLSGLLPSSSLSPLLLNRSKLVAGRCSN